MNDLSNDPTSAPGGSRYKPLFGAIAVVALVATIGAFFLMGESSDALPSAVRKVLDQGETFTLYSLDPRTPEDAALLTKTPEQFFHDFRILGKTEITDRAERTKLLGALYAGIDDRRESGVKCFWPRHGVKATLSGETVELAICFECGWVDVFSKQGRKVLTTTGWRQPVFDETLKKAGVPLPKPRGAGLSSEGEAAPSP